MRTTLKRIFTISVIIALLFGNGLAQTFAERAKETREFRVEKLRHAKERTKYRDISSSVMNVSEDKKQRAVEAIKKSIKKNGDYRLFFRSSDDISKVRTRLAEYDDSISVNKTWNGLYELRVNERSDFSKYLLVTSNNDSLPTVLAESYEVVHPQVLESLQSADYLVGERLAELHWITDIWADGHQEVFSTLQWARVGVIDSGIDATHPDLLGNVEMADGYDFVENDSNPQDDNGHWTFVSGIIAGRINAGWIFGVDSFAKVVPLKILGADWIGSSYDLIRALDFAAKKDIKVLNVSLGGFGNPVGNPVCDAISNAKALGTSVIVAAWNSSSDISGIIPAGCSDAIAVGALNSFGNIAEFSNFGMNVWAYAPGTEILSTWKNWGYQTLDWTSASAAFVSGLVGVLYAKDPSSTQDSIKSKLSSNDKKLTVASLFSSITVPNPNVSASGGVERPVTTVPSDSMSWSNTEAVSLPAFPEMLSAMSVSTGWLMAWYRFESNVSDSGGAGNNGILYGNSNEYVPWISGQALHINNLNNSSAHTVNDYVQLPVVSITDISLSYWVRFRSNAYEHAGVTYSVGDDSGPYFANIITREGILVPIVHVGGNSASLSTDISDGKWHHIGVSLGSQLKLFKDGVSIGAVGTSFPHTITWANQYLWLHQWWGGGGASSRFNGDLDEFRIYNRALSDGEILSAYSEGLPNTSSARPSPQLSGLYLDAYNGSVSKLREGNQRLIENFWESLKTDTLNAGDPVTLSTGEFTYSNTFLRNPGVKVPYEFSLTYRNQLPYDGPVGQSFDHNYNVFLHENDDDSVNFYNGKLGIFNFPTIEGGYVRNDALRAVLTKDVAGHFILSFDEGAHYEFGTNFKVSKYLDRYGNSLTFGYSSDERLATVADTLGRITNYEYGVDTRLASVTGFDGKKAELAYYNAGDASGTVGDLKSVTLRSGTENKTISFTYAGTTHNIATLVDAKGQTYVSNAYDPNGRVTSQQYGSGILSYSYTLSGSSVETNTVTNAEGIVTKYTYDANCNVTERRIYDRTGDGATVYRYEYYSDARLKKTVLPRSNWTTYLYDSLGNVIEERRKANADALDSPTDLITAYEYDGTFGVPVKITDPNGFVKTAALDGSGNVVSETATGILNADGTKYFAMTRYEYDIFGQLVKKILPEGEETVFDYASGSLVSSVRGTGASAVIETFSYDERGNPASSTDGEGNMKTFAYDAFGQLSIAKTALGNESRYAYDANGNKTREEIYSSTGVLASRTDYAYDALDKVVTKTVKTGVDSSVAAYTAYDANGNVVSEKVGNGAEVRTAYDEMGRVKERRAIADPNDPSKVAVTAYAYDRNGNPLSVTDSLGNVTTNVYDGFDRKIRSTDPLGNITTYAYDEAGNAVETRTYSSAQVLVSRTFFLHDGAGHVIRTVRKGDNGVPDAVMTVRYAPGGNVVETVDAMGNATAYAYDSLGRKTSVTDPLGNRAETSYDKRGLVTETRLVGNGSENAVTTRYGYDADGRKTVEKAVTSTGTFDAAYSYGTLAAPLSVTDADGNRTDFAYDLAGRKTAETRYLADGTPVTTSYGYDGNGNLASVSDAEGKSTAYSYDALGRNVRVAYPDWTHKDYEYDKAGNRVGETLARGVEISMQYDPLGRPVSREATGSWIPVPESETYSYDALGYLVSATSSGSSLGFSYDFLWRMASETQDGKTVEYGYDANGSRLSVSASGYLAEYSRDALGRIVSASLDVTGILSRSYSGAFLVSDSFWNGSRTDYSYDALGRLNSLSRPGLPSASRGYAYSPAGNVTSDGTRNYAYDPLSRLVSAGALPDSAHPAGAESFGYDKANNRTASEIAGTSASYSGNLLDQYVSATSGSGTETYSYDADGNMSTDGKFLYSYDSKNRLIGVKNPDGSSVASYAYDPLGRRTSKTTAEGRTGYLYSGENAITETFAPAGAGTPRETSNLFGDSPDELLAYSSDVSATTPEEASERLFCALRVAPYGQDFSRYGWNALVLRCAGLEDTAGVFERKTFAVLSDRLGSPVALVDGSGSTVLEYSYSAFGEAYAKSWTGNFVPAKETGTLLNNARLFAGREFDAETGLYYNRARTYSPELGRFLQRDPVWQSDQVNPYAYVGNDPLGFTDPSGEVVFVAVAPLVVGISWGQVAMDIAVIWTSAYVGHEIASAGSANFWSGTFAWPDIFNPGLPTLEWVPDYRAWTLDPTVGSQSASKSCKSMLVLNASSFGGGGNKENLDKRVWDLVKGSLKKSKSYHSPYADKLLSELNKLAKEGDTMARKMLKLIKEPDRLLEKGNKH